MSAHALLSPSAAHRWLNCTPAPRLEETLPERTSTYAEEGTLAHSVSELAAQKQFTVMNKRTFNTRLKKLKANPLWDAEMLATAEIYKEHLNELYMQFEHAPYIALEVKVDFSDWAPEAFGTCDCIMIGGDELIVTDYKHGKGVPVSAEMNPQMLLYALGALALYRPIYGNKIQKVSIYIDQPRLNNYSGYSLTAYELLAWGEDVVKPKAAIAFAGLGEYVPGDWCKFCRAKAQCRARAGTHTALEDFKDALLPDNAPVEGWTPGGEAPPLLTDAEVGDLLVRGKTLADWYKSLEEYALAACLNGVTIPGWKAVEGRSNRAWTDQDKALETILAAGHPRELVYDSVPKTLAQLEKLVGTKAFAELVSGFVHKPPGKPALAPESDKRLTYNPAASDFAGVGKNG